MGIPQLADLVLETANAPGTGAIILGGAPEGRQTFADAFPAGGEVFYYASDGQQTEWGIGTLVVGSPNTLARTKVLGNLFGTANALNFSSSITVWCEVPAQNAPAMDDTGLLPVSGNPDWDRDVALSAKAAEKRYAAAGSYLDLAKTEQQKVAGPVAFAGEVTLGGKTTVPAISDYGGDDALSGKSAEARYTRSAPADGSTDKRITDIWENADGRTVTGDGQGSNILASLSDLAMSDPMLKMQPFVAHITHQTGGTRVSFPKAFKPKTTPFVILPNTSECTTAGWWISNVILGALKADDGTSNLRVDNEGFWVGGYLIGQNAGAGGPIYIPVLAIGVYG